MSNTLNEILDRFTDAIRPAPVCQWRSAVLPPQYAQYRKIGQTMIKPWGGRVDHGKLLSVGWSFVGYVPPPIGAIEPTPEQVAFTEALEAEAESDR